jgi:membrane fusion protein, macrolide-specific efflux system
MRARQRPTLRDARRSTRLLLARRPTLLLNAALAALALAVAVWSYQVVAGSNATPASGSGQRQRVVPVTQGTVTSMVSASGSVQSATTAAANFVTAGTVTEILVKVGDPVTKGQVLAKVDPGAAQSQLDTAAANLDAATQSLNRARAAGADAATVSTASAQVTSAQAALTAARRAVDGTVLTAPIAGTVIAVNGAAGSPSGSGTSGNSSSGAGSGAGSGSASSGAGFIQLADLTAMRVSASFAEADATKLKVGQVAAVTWNALSGARATGKVLTISPTATTQNNVNTYAVVVSLDTLPAGVRLGQSTTVQVTVDQVDNVLRIPTIALREAGGQSTVQVQVGGAIEVRTVEVGVRGNQFVEITGGLGLGDQVVITTQITTNPTGNPRGIIPGGGPGGGFGGGGNR